MESESSLIGKRIRIILENGFRYTGDVIDESPKNLILIDLKNSRVQVSRDIISLLEVVE